MMQKYLEEQKDRTLREYIGFLRDNKLVKEAYFYSTEVVGLLNLIGVKNPLDMTTEQVMYTLYSIKEDLEGYNQGWEYSLVGE